LADHGVAGLNVNDVAARAGVHETSIYRRWGTRDKLILDAVLDDSERSLPIPDTGRLRSDLIALLNELANYLTSPLGCALAHVMAVAGRDPVTDDARAEFWRARRQVVQPIFERAIARGELPATTDCALLMETVSAPLHYRTLISHEPLDPAWQSRVIDLVLGGASDPTGHGPAGQPA
jgi:AcrR family transcriptional regulator